MSVDRCENCRKLMDTDFDEEFYDEDGIGLCEACREAFEEDRLEDERLDDPRHGQAKDINR